MENALESSAFFTEITENETVLEGCIACVTWQSLAANDSLSTSWRGTQSGQPIT